MKNQTMGEKIKNVLIEIFVKIGYVALIVAALYFYVFLNIYKIIQQF